MNFLPQQNRRVGNEQITNIEPILATNKHVIVIGGGDTGSDCIGTSIRQGALSVTQLEIMPTPPEKENKLITWPNWPLKMRTSSSQEEGADRKFSILTQKFEGSNGNVVSLQCVKVNDKFEPINGTEFNLKSDLVLLAMGFVSPVIDNLTKDLKLKLDSRNNVSANENNYKTSHEKVWVAGDMRRGQSLVVWAIREGRQCAYEVDKALMGESLLAR
jgi:glutamate synthase (NADPH/NADH) small chain